MAEQTQAVQAQPPQKSPYDTYQTSLTSRYCSNEMTSLFSQRSRHSTWRKLWLGLAESESELGIDIIKPEALDQMRAHLTVTDADFEVARVEEKIRRHDVMAHVHAFGAVAPAAAGVIHYGATSCYVTDNAELILMRDALDILINKMAKVIANLQAFSLKWKDEPTLAYTHLQSAQPITVGRRSAQWLQDLMFDLEALESVRNGLKFRGAKGTTGTQASFLEMLEAPLLQSFQGDHAKCDALDEKLCKRFGFSACYDISSQTYSRKVDLIVANAVAGLASTAHKAATDIRLLASWKEIEEPFEKSRMDIPEMFLLAEAILIGLDNVTDGLVVYPARIRSRFLEELPFMITETIIMKLVAKGASRQEAHEEIRVLSHQASSVVKNEGKPNDLIERIRNTEYFKPIWGDLDSMMQPKLYVGRSVQIVEKYCGAGGPVEKALAPYQQYIAGSATAQLNV
ncbi:L-Aspartase-like protein [Camillea tinctor]|nr:L-Aspartase-like protein [Camillea tinctor]